MDYNWALEYSAREGHLEAMILLKDWGATDYNWSLMYAAGGGHVEAIKVLKDYGATDYDKALRYVVSSRNSCSEVEILLRTWISERGPI
jgi:hypothetical protein